MKNWDEQSIHENLSELIESKRWEGFEAYLRSRLTFTMGEIIKASDPNTLLMLQGRCRSYNDLLNLKNTHTILRPASTPDNNNRA
jgi:hypothetical protein